MRRVCLFFLITTSLLCRLHATEKAESRSIFTLCQQAEAPSLGQHRIKFMYNYATHVLLYQFQGSYEWWTDEPLWGFQYELGLGNKLKVLSEETSIILNLGGGTRKRVERHAGGEEVTTERSVGFELWYKMVTSKGRGFLPSSAVLIGLPPGGIHVVLSNTICFFKYSIGTELYPTNIVIPLPASWFVGFSLHYKGIGASLEYRVTPWEHLTVLWDEGGILLTGLNFNLSKRLSISLKYVKIFYDKESHELWGTPTYTERLGADISFSFERKKK